METDRRTTKTSTGCDSSVLNKTVHHLTVSFFCVYTVSHERVYLRNHHEFRSERSDKSGPIKTKKYLQDVLQRVKILINNFYDFVTSPSLLLCVLNALIKKSNVDYIIIASVIIIKDTDHGVKGIGCVHSVHLF
jgi:hypothetical protein